MANQTKTLYLNGVVEWAHQLFIPDDFRGVRKWKVNFYPDDKATAEMKNHGVQLRFKDGTYGKFVTAKRETERDFGRGPQQLAPPVIVDANGNKWPEDKAIGNGSKGTLKLEVYKSQMGIGTRVVGFKVTELVEYERPERDDDNNQNEAIPF